MQQEEQQYLFDYLEEEFRGRSGVRVRVLPSNADTSGVTVRTESREYFFPFQWVHNKAFDEIEKLVKQIKEITS